MNINNLSDRKKAVLTGFLILIAYGVVMAAVTDSKTVVLISDTISGLAVIGIAFLMFPLFKVISSKPAILYMVIKIFEGILMVAGGIFFLDESLLPMRELIYNVIHLYAFIISGFLFYYLLYKTEIVPYFISLWGTIAILSLLLKTIAGYAGIRHPILDFLLILIVSNEIFLAIWLMVKGFNLRTIKS